jgi:hypothetical protein
LPSISVSSSPAPRNISGTPALCCNDLFRCSNCNPTANSSPFKRKTAVSPESGRPHRMSDYRDAAARDCSLNADSRTRGICSGWETGSQLGANGRAMKFTATNHASSTSGRCSFPQLRDMPVTLDARGTRMTLTGPACVSRLAKLMIGISLPTFDLGFKTWLRAYLVSREPVIVT